MRFKNGRVFANGTFTTKDVYIAGDRFVAKLEYQAMVGNGEADNTTIDLQGKYLIPGMIDIHTHGALGHDCCEGTPEALDVITRFEAAHGVTSFCPTTMTFPEEKLTQVMGNIANYKVADDAAAIVGINMEGPFISPKKVGVQNPDYVQTADVEMVRRLQAAAKGLIKLVDIAPEEPGNLAAISDLANEVRVSLAHTCADYNQSCAAFNAGATHVTHLYNAMTPLHHRAPGLIAAAAERAKVTPELICDGLHVHPAMVRTAFLLFGPQRVIMISDSMEATGMPDGDYVIGDSPVHKTGNAPRMADGTLAGSATPLSECLHTAVTSMGIPLEQAVAACTINPAYALGISQTRGRIAAGCYADAVVLDSDFRVEQVCLRGKML